MVHIKTTLDAVLNRHCKQHGLDSASVPLPACMCSSDDDEDVDPAEHKEDVADKMDAEDVEME
jgi:hypothetical protein